jgi:hypothetical protein
MPIGGTGEVVKLCVSWESAVYRFQNRLSSPVIDVTVEMARRRLTHRSGLWPFKRLNIGQRITEGCSEEVV